MGKVRFVGIANRASKFAGKTVQVVSIGVINLWGRRPRQAINIRAGQTVIVTARKAVSIIII